ncbi:MAG: cyclase family protein [Bacteroidota bacterium]
MKVHLRIAGQAYTADLQQPVDISIPLRFDGVGPNCFYAPLAERSPVVAGDFVGSTAEGGLLNFMNVKINPHGNGTHTECVGHIAKEPYYLGDCLKTFHFAARLVSIYPRRQDNGDRVVERTQLAEVLKPGEVPAVVLRTLPNDEQKLSRNYSGTNPPYLQADAAQLLVDYGVEHLLLDLPSVDREEDDGALSAHRAFWQYPYDVRKQATITEMIYVTDEVPDGLYLVQHQITSMVLDASPSKPVLYALANG